MNDYFRLAWEAPDDSGAEPVEPDAPETEPTEEEVEEPSFRLSELAEVLPHFDRFTRDHEGLEAVRQYGSAYDNSRRLISTGGHMTPQEEAAYIAAGIDPAEVQIPQYEEAEPEAPGLWGTPWQEPTTWEEVQAYANTDDPNARRLAAMAVMRDPQAPEDIKNAYFGHWAQLDPAGATAYNQQVMLQRQDEMRQALKDEILAEMSPLKQEQTDRYVTGVLSRGIAEIPGLRENAIAVNQLMNERKARFPGYEALWEGSDSAAQLAELQELTLIAANRAAPARKDAQAAAGANTEAAMLAARTETSRTNGAPETDADAERRKEREQMRRVGARIF